MTRHPTLLHPDPHRPRFTHPAFSRLLVPPFLLLPIPAPPSRVTAAASHIYIHLSLFLSAARSFGDAAALSNSRCNIQRLLAVVCGGGSAIATKKRAPRGRSLRPSNWRRCPSTVARMIVLSFASVPFLPLSILIPLRARALSPFNCFLLPSSPLCFYYFFLSLSLLIPLPPLSRSHRTSSIRPFADVEASMQPSRRWFIANRECVTDFSSLLVARPRPCFESFLRK